MHFYPYRAARGCLTIQILTWRLGVMGKVCLCLMQHNVKHSDNVVLPIESSQADRSTTV